MWGKEMKKNEQMNKTLNPTEIKIVKGNNSASVESLLGVFTGIALMFSYSMNQAGGYWIIAKITSTLSLVIIFGGFIMGLISSMVSYRKDSKNTEFLNPDNYKKP